MIRRFCICILLLAVIFSTSYDIFAQKEQKKVKKTVVSEETRKQSGIYAEGLRAFYSDNYTEAETNFRKVIELNSKNDAAYYMLARIYRLKKDYTNALTYIGEAIKLDKSNVWYKVELAEIYDIQNDYKKSAKLWEEISKLKPENEFYLMNLGDAYVGSEQYAKIIDVYNRLEILMGYDENITNAKVNVWLYINDIKHALGEYDKLIKEFPNELHNYVSAGKVCQSNNMPEEAVRYFSAALKVNPDYAEANMAIADYYLNQDRYDMAFDALLKGFAVSDIKAEEKLPALKKYFSAAIRTPSNVTTRQCEQLAMAFKEAHPDRIEGYASMATMMMLTKQYPEAQEYFEQALGIDGSTFSLWEDYFFCLSKKGDFKTMITKGKEVLELFPTNASMLYNIAYAYYSEQQYDEAIELLQQALTYSYDNNLLANVYNLLGDCYKSLGNKEEALRNWKIAERKGINIQEKIRANE